ncbi:hypothetical protein SAMN02910418_02439 [Bowdeniella nasicola]|uniref:Uncharacterized protein n=2 Tax=Bowdeniella nasicola TaxID=208480 RepID=A0A1H4E406_9ACTO|nr:hypothetical protein SAMN02910418_02439 [Bowdeniella nasicola]
MRRGEVGMIDVPTRLVKPRRFDIILSLRGVTWRRVQFEVSPDEAGIGQPMRTWPPALVAHTHWADDYARAAASGTIRISLEDAVGELNTWIMEIADLQ